MTYNMDFLLSALIFLLLILYHFSTQQRLGPANNRTFLFFMLLGIADILFDLICTLLIAAENPALRGVTELSLVLLYVMQVLVPYTLFFYIQSLRETSRERKMGARILCLPPAVFMGLVVLSNHWSGALFQVTEEGVYVYGPLYLSMYLYALFYGVLIALSSLVHYKELGWKKFRIIWEFLFIMAICVAIQGVFNELLMTSFGISLGIAVLFLTLNNPYHYMDNLTGVLDIQYFRELAQEEMNRGRRFHLIAVDLHQLKQLNKVMGAGAGNQMLIQAAHTLWEISGSHLVFRITGNRFLLLMYSLTEYETVRNQIQQYFSHPIELKGEMVNFPAILCGVFHGEVLRESDILLTYIEYLISVVPKVAETVVIQGDERTLKGFRYNQEIERFLEVAVEQDLFEVYYQPVYSTERKGYVTLEALSRLRHPNLGPVSPEVFIGIAEKNDQIAKIGLMQFRRVCRFIKEHEALMSKIENVKFNLSPAELLKSGHSRRLIEIIEEYGLKPTYFQFEITETVATKYSEDLYQAVNDFQEAGIGLCLDDFGSGYANLNTVLQLPFSSIKLDKSLLRGICDTPKVATFYQSIVKAMKNMGYRVISEGVESQKELDLVCQWGVTMIQGYYFSEPVSEKRILEELLPQEADTPTETAPVLSVFHTA